MMTKLKMIRLNSDLNIAELAERAGVSNDTISRIENRKRADGVKLNTYNKIAEALGVHTLDIIEDDLLI